MASSRDRRFILWLEEIGADDAPFVGGKIALLGEVARHLGRRGVRVPPGFAVTAQAYRHFVREAGFFSDLKRVMSGLDPKDLEDVALRAKQARELFLMAKFPSMLEVEITKSYRKLCSRMNAEETRVAVRSSVVREKAPEAPVGLHDTVLNVKGEYGVIDACRRCFASLFSGRAVSDLVARGIDPISPVLAIAVQQMVRSDAACSGRATSFDPRSGFSDVIVIQGSYGIWGPSAGEGTTPDEFVVHKPTLRKGFRPVLNKRIGTKEWKRIAGLDPDPVPTPVPVLKRDRGRYVVSDDEVLELARGTMGVEAHLGRTIELSWAKDGDGVSVGSGLLFVLQVTSLATRSRPIELTTYVMDASRGPQEELLRGKGFGEALGCGRVRVIGDAGRLSEFTVGSVLVAESTDPEWEQAIQVAAAVITVQGDGSRHAARFCSELGVPCLVGAGPAVKRLVDGMDVTVDCRDEIGIVLTGQRPYRIERVYPTELPGAKAELMLMAGHPDRVFFEARYPNDGVGMAALDAIIEEQIGIHPFAFLDFDQLQSRVDQAQGDGAGLAVLVDAIQQRAGLYRHKADWLVECLSWAIGSVAAGSYREVAGRVKGEVFVRISSISSDRYARLLGGDRYEPKPGDPLRDLRGAGRHCHPVYGRAFSLECRAIKRVRDEMGLSNVKVIAPLCRTPEEGRRLVSLMERHGLVQGENGLEIYLQVQAPSNLLLIEQFGRLFDGFIVDADDLLSLAMGRGDLDHDQALFREGAAAARRFCRDLLQGAKRLRPQRRIGFCVSDPGPIPSWVAFFAGMGSDFIATRPNKLLSTRLIVAFAELARQERKQLVLVEADPATGRETIRLGVPIGWLRDRAKRWAGHLAGQVRELPPDGRKAVAAFLGVMTPVVQIERAGEERELFCWRPEDVDAVKEKRARAVKPVRIQPIGSLNARELMEVAHRWAHQARAAGRTAPETNSNKARGLIKRFENARAEFVAEMFTRVVTETFGREMQQP